MKTKKCLDSLRLWSRSDKEQKGSGGLYRLCQLADWLQVRQETAVETKHTGTWAWNKHTTYVVTFYRQITQFIKYDASLVDSGSHVYIKHLKLISLPRVAAVKHFNVNASVILLQSHIKNEINTDRLTDYECWCIFDALHIKDGL